MVSVYWGSANKEAFAKKISSKRWDSNSRLPLEPGLCYRYAMGDTDAITNVGAC